MAKSIVTDEDRYVPHITEVPDLVDCLPELAEEYRELHEAITEAEERKKELSGQIKALLDAVGVRSVRGNGWVATRVKDTETESISATRLLALGVTIEQIQEATEKKPKAGYIQVTRPKE